MGGGKCGLKRDFLFKLGQPLTTALQSRHTGICMDADSNARSTTGQREEEKKSSFARVDVYDSSGRSEGRRSNVGVRGRVTAKNR